eukprot:TRINITY_DN3301_c0_g3_i2.p1 TRINITY_DN3301_c0_g3~~TRINITY_DN3301_c0_g3_i2.p1  ORF type:complete len:438 (+),score=105.75 TRINITY_DN3301_c0_g3_i2:38-1351(+)
MAGLPEQHLVVRVLEWKGHATEGTTCRLVFLGQEYYAPSGAASNIGMTWGQHEIHMPCRDPVNDTLVMSIVDRGNELASVRTNLGAIPTLHSNERTQLVLSSAAGIQMGTLSFTARIDGGARTSEPGPSAPLFSSANLPEPTAPPMPNAPQQPPPQAMPQQAPYPQAQAQQPYPQAPPPPPSPPVPTGPMTGPACQIQTNPSGPLRYTGLPPMPPPAITSPTPTEVWRDHVMKTNADKERKEAEYKAKATTQPQPKGLMSKLGAGLQAAAHHTSFVKEATHSAEVALRQHDDTAMMQQWRKVFAALADTDVVECGYRCMFVNGTEQLVEGTVFVSRKHLSFIPTVQNSPQPPFYEDLRNIVTHYTQVYTGQPSVQVYTRAGFMFQFCRFIDDIKRQVGTMWGTVHGSSFDCFMIYLDRHWRAATPVPVPGILYAQYK